MAEITNLILREYCTYHDKLSILDHVILKGM